MLVMIGAWIVMQNTEQYVWSGVALSINSPFPNDPLVLGPLSVSWNRVYVFVVATALIGATYYLVNRTRLGKDGWNAIATIAVALITGLVTIVTHVWR